MTTDAYREMARVALRATQDRGDAAMARYFGEAGMMALAGRIRRLQRMAALRIASVCKWPGPALARIADTATGEPNVAQARPHISAAQPNGSIAQRGAMAASKWMVPIRTMPAAGGLAAIAGRLGILALFAGAPKRPPAAAKVAAPLRLWLARRVAGVAPSRRLLRATQRATAPAIRAAPVRSLCASRAIRSALPRNMRPVAESQPALGRFADKQVPGRAISPVIGFVSASPAMLPGFHNTVRPHERHQAASDVYLDKQVLGRLLAPVISAEQSRAAARPSTTGNAFNTGMAPLRPAYAGAGR
jgi:hypothetical protein